MFKQVELREIVWVGALPGYTQDEDDGMLKNGWQDANVNPTSL